MGCGGSTRAAVAPQCVFSDVVPRKGSFSGVVPDNVTSNAKRGWEEADVDERADQPSHQLKREKEQQQLEGSRKELGGDIPPPNPSMLERQFPKMPEEERMELRQPEDVVPQAPLIPPSGPGGEQENKGGKESTLRGAQRSQTIQDVPEGEKIKDPDLCLCLNDNVVPEPLNLQVYESFKYNPTREHFAEGHPLAPCWPSHQRHIKRMAKHLKHFGMFPDKFKDLVMHRRAKMSKKKRPRLPLEGEEDEEEECCR